MNRRSMAGPVVKSLIFIVVTVTVTAVLAISIAHTGVSATVSYQAVFTDVTGLNVGDDVDIAGVRVGDVTSISIYKRNLALVGFAIQQGRTLPASGRRRAPVPDDSQPAEAAEGRRGTNRTHNGDNRNHSDCRLPSRERAGQGTGRPGPG